jgi:hypothetical protein
VTEFGNSLEKILAELPVTNDRDTLPAGIFIYLFFIIKNSLLTVSTRLAQDLLPYDTAGPRKRNETAGVFALYGTSEQEPRSQGPVQAYFDIEPNRAYCFRVS